MRSIRALSLLLLLPLARALQVIQRGAASVTECISKYADALDSISPGLGTHLHNHTMTASKTDAARDLILGAGQGSTGTKSLELALEMFGLTGWHWADNEQWEQWLESYNGKFMNGSRNDRYHYPVPPKEDAECHRYLQHASYTSLPEGLDFVLDDPVPENFVNIFLSYPSAKVLLTTRPPAEWVKDRIEKHHFFTPPIQEPCGKHREDFSESQIQRMYEYHTTLVECIVPPDQLLKFDLFADPEERLNGLMTEISSFLGLPPLVGASEVPRTKSAAEAQGPDLRKLPTCLSVCGRPNELLKPEMGRWMRCIAMHEDDCDFKMEEFVEAS